METQYKNPINKSFKIASSLVDGRRITRITDLATGEELHATSITIHFECDQAFIEMDYHPEWPPMLNETGTQACCCTLRGSVEGEFSFDSKDVQIAKWL